MCGEPIAEPHSHVASLSERRLLCTCRACYLLFTAQGAGAPAAARCAGAGRAGQRLHLHPGAVGRPGDSGRSRVPVPAERRRRTSRPRRRSSPATRARPARPSPSSTSSAWADIVADNPTLADVEPDVEAVLVRRNGERRLHLPRRADRRLLRTRRHRAPVLVRLPGRRRGVAAHRRLLRPAAHSSPRPDGADMPELEFACTGAHPDHRAAAPTISLRLHITETTGDDRCTRSSLRTQIRIEPRKRRYDDTEAEAMRDLFGERARWGDTLKPLAARLRQPGGAELHRRDRRSTWRCRAATTSTSRRTSTSTRSTTARCRCCCCSAAPYSPSGANGFSVVAGARGTRRPPSGCRSASGSRRCSCTSPARAWLRLSERDLRRVAPLPHRPAAASAGTTRSTGC